MVLPNNNINNNINIYRCQICGELKMCHSGYSSGLLCDLCFEKMRAIQSIESGGLNQTDGLPTDNLLLDTYYKRDIKISFSNTGDKFSMYYTVMMIPNKDNWLNEKIEESENKLKSVGLKDISFKMMSGFSEMEDYEISSYMNDKTFNMRLSSNSYSTVTLPLILKNYANAQSKIKWSGFGWKMLHVFVLLASVFLTLSSALLAIYFLYNRIYAGFIFIPISIISAKTTYEIIKEL